MNSSPTAERDFIQLKLAYEYLSSPRRKIIPKTVKKKASYQTKKRSYDKHKAKEQRYRQRAKGKRTVKKEIEFISWYDFWRDMLRLGKGMLMFSLFSSIAVTIFVYPNGMQTVLQSLFIMNSFIGIFSALIFFIFMISYLPDILKSTSSKNRSRSKT